MDGYENGFDSLLADAVIDTVREPLVVLDGELRVIVASKAFYDKFDIRYEKIQGKLFYELGNGQWNIPALSTLLEQIIPERTTVESYEVEHDFLTLGPRTMVINAREVKYENNQRKILLSILDVTKQRKTESDKARLMQQKDNLLKEMRHRIANSLQLIASIILLKAGTVKSEEGRLHLEDAHDRILSIATVQRNLDVAGENDRVHVTEYLTTLCQSVASSMIGGRKPITIKVSGGKGTVTSDEAISLGLITTELVINSLKHAFPDGKGQITVTYESKGSDWKLGVGDDGAGMPKTMAPDREGLGTSIVESLANQLNAKIHRESSERGTVVSITYTKAAVKTKQ